jgi:hypothetical protein
MTASPLAKRPVEKPWGRAHRPTPRGAGAEERRNYRPPVRVSPSFEAGS